MDGEEKSLYDKPAQLFNKADSNNFGKSPWRNGRINTLFLSFSQELEREKWIVASFTAWQLRFGDFWCDFNSPLVAFGTASENSKLKSGIFFFWFTPKHSRKVAVEGLFLSFGLSLFKL